MRNEKSKPQNEYSKRKKIRIKTSIVVLAASLSLQNKSYVDQT